uniref:Uncharacterized protein n=1 Tax=Saimiri boliviensis boliviensis TaxID=39432 RepID=A0A2K6U9V4_SAIBB
MKGSLLANIQGSQGMTGSWVQTSKEVILPSYTLSSDYFLFYGLVFSSRFNLFGNF